MFNSIATKKEPIHFNIKINNSRAAYFCCVGGGGLSGIIQQKANSENILSFSTFKLIKIKLCDYLH